MGRGRKKKKKVGKRGSTWKEAPVVSFATCRCSVTASAGVNSESEIVHAAGFHVHRETAAAERSELFGSSRQSEGNIAVLSL